MTDPSESQSPPIVTRAQAVALGLKRYFTGKPCPHGHNGDRFTYNSTCIDCSSVLSGRWRRNNKEHYNNTAAIWVKNNQDKAKKSCREWRHKNVKLIAKLSAAHYAANKVSAADRHKRRHAEAPEIMRAINSARRARKRSAEGRHTVAEIRVLFEKQLGRCAYYTDCKTKLRWGEKNGFHADHIVSLSEGGRNDIRNIQLTCGPCNMRKHTKDPFAFAMERGRLL